MNPTLRSLVPVSALLALGAVLVPACGSDDGGGSAAGGSAGSGGAPSDSGTGGDAGAAGSAGDAGSCKRSPGPPDAVRKVVISHPYDAGSKPSKLYEVLELDSSGKLAKTGKTFELGRSTMGEVVFTPDGELGLVPNEDGTVGIFRFEPDGSVTVLNAGLAGDFYAAKLVVAPGGDRVYVLDSEWRDIGGGIYSLRVGCDDQVTSEGLVAPAKLPQGLWFSQQDPTRALVAADDILTSPLDQNLHLLTWSASPTWVTSAVAFNADSPIISSLGVTHDEKYALIADNSAFSSVPNRVAVVELGASTLTPLQTVSPIEDPADIETSPFDSTALVTSGFGNALYALTFDASKPSAPFTAKELAYQGDAPQLPVDMVQVRRGALEGRVLVAEVPGVRQVAFAAGKLPEDQGVFDLGGGSENVVGAIGVQP